MREPKFRHKRYFQSVTLSKKNLSPSKAKREFFSQIGKKIRRYKKMLDALMEYETLWSVHDPISDCSFAEFLRATKRKDLIPYAQRFLDSIAQG